MATLTVAPLTLDGVVVAEVAAAAGGDQFPAGSRTFLLVTTGAARTITIADQGSVSPDNAEAFDADSLIVTGGAESRIAGPFPISRFGDDNGMVQVTYSDETGVTLQPFRIGS